MSGILSVLALLAMFAVGAVLLFGLTNLMKGGPSERSQQLMRLRVMLQALAVLIIVVMLVLARR